jgi:hypothetical protein
MGASRRLATKADAQAERPRPSLDWAIHSPRPGCRGPPRPNRRPPPSSLSLLGDSGFPAPTEKQPPNLLSKVQKCTFCRDFALQPSYVAPHQTALQTPQRPARVSLHIQVKKPNPPRSAARPRGGTLPGASPAPAATTATADSLTHHQASERTLANPASYRPSYS